MDSVLERAAFVMPIETEQEEVMGKSDISKLEGSFNFHERANEMLAHGKTNIDVFVGARLRRRREELGISKQSLSAITSINSGLLERYESGQERLNANLLLDFTDVLRVKIMYFFPTEKSRSR